MGVPEDNDDYCRSKKAQYRYFLQIMTTSLFLALAVLLLMAAFLT